MDGWMDDGGCRESGGGDDLRGWALESRDPIPSYSESQNGI